MKLYIPLLLLVLVALSACTQVVVPEEDYGVVYSSYHSAYKKVLFATGQNSPESSDLMVSFKSNLQSLASLSDTPYSEDVDYVSDIDKIVVLTDEASSLIDSSNLEAAHSKLEELRPIWQDIFKRNNVYSRTFYMTEFHEVMEGVVEAVGTDELDLVSSECVDLRTLWDETLSVSNDLSSNEQFNSLWSAESANIDSVCSLDGDLIVASDKLKKGFIQTYLAFG